MLNRDLSQVVTPMPLDITSTRGSSLNSLVEALREVGWVDMSDQGVREKSLVVIVGLVTWKAKGT